MRIVLHGVLDLPLTSAIPAGPYTAFSFLVRGGGDPQDRSQWQSNLAETSFTFSNAASSGGSISGATVARGRR